MSQDLRKDQNGGRDISRTTIEGIDNKMYDGFEGMNYEQFRQPYNPNYQGRNSVSDERKERNRPDES